MSLAVCPYRIEVEAEEAVVMVTLISFLMVVKGTAEVVVRGSVGGHST